MRTMSALFDLPPVAPEGFRYEADFVTPDEEQALATHLAGLAFEPFQFSGYEGRRRVIRTDVAVLYVGDEAEKQALLRGEPERFFTTPAYDGLPLVMLRLAAVDAERLAELVTDAWRMRTS